MCVTTVVGSLNTAQLSPFIPEIAGDLGHSVSVIGQAATAFLVVGALGGLVIGPIADHYGHRRVLMTGLALSALSSVTGGLAPNFLALLFTRLVGGLGMAATIGIVFAVASSRYSGAVRLRALSIVTGTFALIGIFGIPMLTGLSAWVGWRGAWIFVGLLAIVALLTFAVFGPQDERRKDGRLVMREIINSYQALLGSRRMVLFFAGGALQGALFLALLTYYGAYFIDELGLSVQEFGFVAALGAAAFAAGSFLAGRLGGFDMRMLFGATMIASGFLIAPAYLKQTGVISSALFIALGIFAAGVGGVAMLKLLADNTPIGQATTLVFNESVFSFGAAAGAATGGVALSFGSFGAFAILLPVLGLAAGLLFWRPRSTHSTVVQADGRS